MRKVGTQQLARKLNLPSTKAEAETNRLHEEMCSREGDSAHEAANKDQAEYDKQLLTLSVGFLAISLGFIKDIVKLNDAIHRGWLYVSFGLLTSSVLLVLFSFQFSIVANLKARDYWEALKHDRNANFPYAYSKRIHLLNRCSGILFALGIVFTVSFVIANIHKEASVPKEEPHFLVSEGQCLKVPANGQISERGLIVKEPPPARPPQTIIPPPSNTHHPEGKE